MHLLFRAVSLHFRSNDNLSIKRVFTCALGNKRDHISGDENLREPFRPDHGIGFGIEEHNETREDHVNGRGEQGRSEKK